MRLSIYDTENYSDGKGWLDNTLLDCFIIRSECFELKNMLTLIYEKYLISITLIFACPLGVPGYEGMFIPADKCEIAVLLLSVELYFCFSCHFYRQ